MSCFLHAVLTTDSSTHRLGSSHHPHQQGPGWKWRTVLYLWIIIHDNHIDISIMICKEQAVLFWGLMVEMALNCKLTNKVTRTPTVYNQSFENYLEISHYWYLFCCTTSHSAQCEMFIIPFNKQSWGRSILISFLSVVSDRSEIIL